MLHDPHEIVCYTMKTKQTFLYIWAGEKVDKSVYLDGGKRRSRIWFRQGLKKLIV